MSNREDELHPFSEKLFNSRDPVYEDPSKPRTADFFDSEVDVDWSKCDRPQPDDTETFANNPQWVRDHDRRDYRIGRIHQILKDVCVRNRDEPFHVFVERAYCQAQATLSGHGKGEHGNDFPTLLDRWVYRFVLGFKLISRLSGKKWDPADEKMLTKLIREECEILTKQDEMFTDPHERCRKVKRGWEPVKEDLYMGASTKSGSRNYAHRS